MNKQFSLCIEDADGPTQLTLMDNHSGHGKRLLGAKGSPYKEIIKRWDLTKDELADLIDEMDEICGRLE